MDGKTRPRNVARVGKRALNPAARTIECDAAIVGAGPVGLTAAIDLCRRGVSVCVLEAETKTGEGSRAICFAKRTLEIFDRLGACAPMMKKGVVWNRGKVFHRDNLVFAFDLLPEKNHKFPAFINLQQYYCDRYLAARVDALDKTALMRGARVIAVSQDKSGVTLTTQTAKNGGAITKVRARYALACDGAKSTLRRLLGLPFVGAAFRDRFLIADVKMKSDFPGERRFWFDPPFHPGKSALLHKQPDNVWRIDLQLGWHADPDVERRPERVRPRLRAMLGDADFDLEWVSVYVFQARRIAKFVHERIIFAGDSAHQVSPFGARGANGGVQDADNLGWKLAAVLQKRASPSLLQTYDAERAAAADENIRHSSRSTGFIAPQNAMGDAFRAAALNLAAHREFARKMINSGRLSTPAILSESALNGGDDSAGAPPGLGAVAPDAPIKKRGRKNGWLLESLGDDFNLLHFRRAGQGAEEAKKEGGKSQSAAGRNLPMMMMKVHSIFPAGEGGAQDLSDYAGIAQRRYAAVDGEVIVLRPDAHICARYRGGDALRRARAAVQHALDGGK
jgi:3-(3-hydroxy-phenyl)propionate hydroxylase